MKHAARRLQAIWWRLTFLAIRVLDPLRALRLLALSYWEFKRRRRKLYRTFALMRDFPKIASTVERWVSHGELPRKFDKSPPKLSWDHYADLVKRACKRTRPAPEVQENLSAKVEQILLSLIGGHPSFLYLWQRMLFRWQFSPEVQKNSWLRPTYLTLRRQDLHLPISSFSGLLTLSVYAAVRFVASCRQLGPLATLQQIEQFHLRHFCQLPVQVFDHNGGDRGEISWEPLQPGDLFVAVLSLKAILDARRELNWILAKYLRRSWCLRLLETGSIDRIKVVNLLREHFQYQAIDPLTKLAPAWAIFHPNAPFDPSVLTPVLSMLSAKLPTPWTEWLAWELAWRVAQSHPQATGIVLTLKKLVKEGGRDGLRFTLQVLTNVTALLCFAARKAVNGGLNLNRDVVVLMATALVALAAIRMKRVEPWESSAKNCQAEQAEGNLLLERSAAFFLRQLKLLLKWLMSGETSRLVQSGLFLESILLTAKEAGLQLDDLEKTLSNLAFRKFLQEWLTHAVWIDPEIRLVFTNWRRGEIQPTRQELRRHTQFVIDSWLRSDKPATESSKGSDQLPNELVELRKTAAKIATYDHQVALICRLAAIKVVCRLRQNLFKGGI